MRRPFAAALVFSLLFAAACAQQARSQAADEPITTLKLGARVVAVSAVVTTRNGQPAPGLTREDFELKQDGRDVPIRYFTQGEDLPLTVAVMVDTSSSQRAFIGDETLAADVFFDALLGRTRENPGDRAMLVQFDDNILDLGALTKSEDRLHLALMRLEQPHPPRPGPTGGTLLYDAIGQTATRFLAGQTGRKAMILLTDGDDHGSTSTLEQALEQAQRADVAIYAIDYTLSNFQTGVSGHRPDPGGIAGRGALEKLTEATGGRVFTVKPQMGLREIFAAIGQQLRLQYELAYTPPADTKPNSFHRIELHANDKRLVVQARKGFYSQP